MSTLSSSPRILYLFHCWCITKDRDLVLLRLPAPWYGMISPPLWLELLQTDEAGSKFSKNTHHHYPLRLQICWRNALSMFEINVYGSTCQVEQIDRETVLAWRGDDGPNTFNPGVFCLGMICSRQCDVSEWLSKAWFETFTSHNSSLFFLFPALYTYNWTNCTFVGWFIVQLIYFHTYCQETTFILFYKIRRKSTVSNSTCCKEIVCYIETNYYSSCIRQQLFFCYATWKSSSWFC